MRDRRRSVPGRLLDPILVLAERIDARRRGIRPIRAEGVLGLELQRWGGPDQALDDGTPVRHGDLVGEMHLRSERARSVARAGWQGPGIRQGRDDLRALAAWAAARPATLRPVAYHGLTIQAAFARRERWQVRPRPRTVRARLDEWFMRWLLVHWNLAGRARLGQGHGRLESVEIWLSAAGLAERYGAAGRREQRHDVPVPAQPDSVGPEIEVSPARPPAPGRSRKGRSSGPRPT